MTTSTETILLTGATGFVGRELLWRLARVPGNEVVCVIRARNQDEADDRLAQILAKARPQPLSADERRRVRAVAGDLTLAQLGLQSGEWNDLASRTTRVIHCGASVDWSMSWEAAHSVNVGGTQSMLDLAAEARHQGVLRRFDYISTCNVCGRRRGNIPEEDLDDSYGFFNHYERSKFEAERLVRASNLPFVTYRLTMVVGDSKTGYASTFKVMYWPLKMLSRGMAWVVPANPGGLVDLVPVDYVCDAIEFIGTDPSSIGRTFHIAAGRGYNSTLGEILELAVRTFGVRAPLLVPTAVYQWFFRPILFLLVWGKRREAMRKGKVYMPYFSYAAEFNPEGTRRIMEARGIRPPRVREYFQTLVNYAIASDWGKRDPGATAPPRVEPVS